MNEPSAFYKKTFKNLLVFGPLYGLLGFAGLTALVFSVVSFFGTSEDIASKRYIDTAFQAAQASLFPITQALEAHHNTAGTYPASLEVLVAGGLMVSIPSVPVPAHARKVEPLNYVAAPDQLNYLICFAYTFDIDFGDDLRYYSFRTADDQAWHTVQSRRQIEEILAIHLPK